ncbi:MAG: hypothetical protein LBR05_09055, partial [Azoarcus sp.]|nr:hypothetical protein [Azoarcus sp.]
MFNQYFIEIYQTLGKKSLVGLLAGTLRKTEKCVRMWAKRARSGDWAPSKQELREIQHNHLRDSEYRDIFDNLPSFKQKSALHTADLIYQATLSNQNLELVIQIASDFDRLSTKAFFAKSNLSDLRNVIADALTWLRGFGLDENESSTVQRLREEVLNTDDLTIFKNDIVEIRNLLHFHILSCWDLVFTSCYFEGLAEPYPSFDLVCPRLDPSIEINAATGNLSRNGTPVERNIVQSPIRRLLDMIAVLCDQVKRRNCTFLKKIPDDTKLASWFSNSFKNQKLTEKTLTKWRIWMPSTKTRFGYEDLDNIWWAIFGLSKNERRNPPCPPPYPILVAAAFWEKLFDKQTRRLGLSDISPNEVEKIMLDIALRSCRYAESYKTRWKQNLAWMKTKGV